MFYVHKVHSSQEYGGSEEGGWWYNSETPIDPADHAYEPPTMFEDEDDAYEHARRKSVREHERRDRENTYNYTSILSYRDDFYSFTISESATFHATPRPHYE